ncbi:MAG: hypothetical protein ACF8PN_07590 [Phycisphaerales bacterium]
MTTNRNKKKSGEPKKKKLTTTARSGDRSDGRGAGQSASSRPGTSRAVSTSAYATPPHLEREVEKGAPARPRPRAMVHHTTDGRIVSVIMTSAAGSAAGGGDGDGGFDPGRAAPPAGVLPPLVGDYGMVGRDATIEVSEIELPDDLRGLDPLEIHERFRVSFDQGASRSGKVASTTMKKGKGSKQASAHAPTLIPIEPPDNKRGRLKSKRK